MTRNVGNGDRIARLSVVLVLAACTALTPLPPWVRIAAFALPGIYLLFTAVSGTCLGYKLIGKSTCPAP